MKNPLVTVIIPAYNHEQYIYDSVMSVVNQDYNNIELIILNDGSKDSTHEKIIELIDICEKRFTRFKYINKTNQGLAITLNQGIDWSEGTYVTVIASDDLMVSCKVSALVAPLEEKGLEFGLAFGDANFIDDRNCYIKLNRAGNIDSSEDAYTSFLQFYTSDRKDITSTDDYYDYKLILKGNYLPAMSVLWRRSALISVGKFLDGIMLEDWDMWLKMSKRYKGVFVDKIVASYRWHDKNSIKTSFIPLVRSMNFLLKRELIEMTAHPDIKKIAARHLLQNTILLIRLKQFIYFKNFFDLNLWRNL